MVLASRMNLISFHVGGEDAEVFSVNLGLGRSHLRLDQCLTSRRPSAKADANDLEAENV